MRQTTLLRGIGLLLASCVMLAARPGVGRAEFIASGIATVTHSEGVRGIQLNRANRQDGEFNALRLLLKGQAEISPTVSLNLEFLLDEQASSNRSLTFLSPWVEVRELFDRPWLNLMAGKLPSVFGTWTERTRTMNNPVIGAPVMWNYHSNLAFGEFPVNGDTLINRSGRGQFGFSYSSPTATGFKGQPTVYEACWDTGIQLYGAKGVVEYAGAVGYGSPGAPAADGTENNDEVGYTGRLGFSHLPGILFGARLGVSAGTGAWLPSTAEVPGGGRAEDFDQTVFGGDIEYGLGPVVARGEFVRSRWDMPESTDPATWLPAHLENSAWYLEGRVDVSAGVFLGGRYDQIAFDPIRSPAGVSTPWDADLNRLELGATWRADRNLAVRYAYQLWRYPDHPELDADVYGIQLWVEF